MNFQLDLSLIPGLSSAVSLVDNEGLALSDGLFWENKRLRVPNKTGADDPEDFGGFLGGLTVVKSVINFETNILTLLGTGDDFFHSPPWSIEFKFLFEKRFYRMLVRD